MTAAFSVQIVNTVGDVTSSDVSITDAAKAKIIPDEIACVLLHLCFSVPNLGTIAKHFLWMVSGFKQNIQLHDDLSFK